MKIPAKLISLLAGALSPAGANAKLIILTYHRVLERADEYLEGEVTEQEFDCQVRFFSRYFNVLSLSDALARRAKGDLPSKALCITFDDGYADNYSCAMKILNKYGVKATFFIASGYLNGGIMWNDKIIEAVRNTRCQQVDLGALGLGEVVALSSVTERKQTIHNIISTVKYMPHEQREEVADSLTDMLTVVHTDTMMMNDSQVQELVENGMEIGGHTVRHPILAGLEQDQIEQEINDGVAYLEDLVGTKINLFAYPNGRKNKDYNQGAILAVKKAGLQAAVTTNMGVVTKNTDLTELPRIGLWEKDEIAVGKRLLKAYIKY